MLTHTTTRFGVAAVIGMATTGPGCRITETNTQHCNYNDGDAFCARMFPDGSRAFCEQGLDSCVSSASVNGCVPEQPMDSCYSPCGGESTLDDDDSCLTPGESSGSTSGAEMTESSGTEGSESSTTGPMPCVDNEDCMDAAAPLCEPESGECVGCDGFEDGDAACAELDANAPLCVANACVACTAEDTTVCDAQALICDEETNACVPCTEHEECESGACDAIVGECIDVANVLHVGFMQPFATVGAALDEVAAMAVDPAMLVLHEGIDFNEVATVDSGVVAFVAADGESPLWINSSVLSPTITVSGAQTRVYLQGLRLAQNGSDLGLLVDAEARVDVRRSQIVANSGGGVLAQNASELTLRNCFVGGDVNDQHVAEATGSTINALYSTLGGGFGSATALTCDAASLVTVRNSLLVTRAAGDELACAPASVEQTASEQDLGGTNTALGDMDTGWFASFGTGDFHLATAPASIGTTARWNAGDPTTDIDGDPRPTTDGASDFAGADVP